MAGPETRLSCCHNLCNNELVKKASIEGSNTHTPILAVSRAFIPALTPTPLFTNELFKQFIKTYLKTQTHLV